MYYGIILQFGDYTEAVRALIKWTEETPTENIYTYVHTHINCNSLRLPTKYLKDI